MLSLQLFLPSLDEQGEGTQSRSLQIDTHHVSSKCALTMRDRKPYITNHNIYTEGPLTTNSFIYFERNLGLHQSSTELSLSRRGEYRDSR